MLRSQAAEGELCSLQPGVDRPQVSRVNPSAMRVTLAREVDTLQLQKGGTGCEALLTGAALAQHAAQLSCT